MRDASKIKFIIEAFCPSTFWAKKSRKSLQKRVNVGNLRLTAQLLASILGSYAFGEQSGFQVFERPWLCTWALGRAEKDSIGKASSHGAHKLGKYTDSPVFEPANHRPGSKNMLKQLRRRINPNSIVAMLQVAISDVVYVAAVLLISSAGGASKLFALPGKSWGKFNMMDFTHRCSDLVFFAGATPEK